MDGCSQNSCIQLFCQNEAKDWSLKLTTNHTLAIYYRGNWGNTGNNVYKEFKIVLFFLLKYNSHCALNRVRFSYIYYSLLGNVKSAGFGPDQALLACRSIYNVQNVVAALTSTSAPCFSTFNFFVDNVVCSGNEFAFSECQWVLTHGTTSVNACVDLSCFIDPGKTNLKNNQSKTIYIITIFIEILKNWFVPKLT